jgi:hypothetical protein
MWNKILRKVLIGIVFFAHCLLLLLSATPISLGEELIPPSRTLQDVKEAYGKLTVASEPSGLEVFLDGSKIGLTPVWLKQVKPGPHKLRVRQAETDIFVKSGKILQISLFKGSFVMTEVELGKESGPGKELPAKGKKVIPDKSQCKYGYYEDPPGTFHCYYGGWGMHVCETDTGLLECKVRGDKAYTCEQLSTDLRAKDCCPEEYGGFSKSFILGACGMQ